MSKDDRRLPEGDYRNEVDLEVGCPSRRKLLLDANLRLRRTEEILAVQKARTTWAYVTYLVRSISGQSIDIPKKGQCRS